MLLNTIQMGNLFDSTREINFIDKQQYLVDKMKSLKLYIQHYNMKTHSNKCKQ